MLFSFISLTYNHQSFINQHLESIKYQIKNFGSDFEFELILCDDASSDATVSSVNEWLIINRDLFKNVSIQTESINKGIVNNFLKSLRSFEGDYFKVLAGDDMCSCSNLFDCVHLLKEWDIVQGALFEFEGEDIKYETEYFEYVVNFRPKNIQRFFKMASLGQFCFRGPGMVFRKELITPQVTDFVKDYKMCEDMPFFYMLLASGNVKICFYETPIVLYRISSSSIARNFAHPAKQILIKDNAHFFSFLSSRTQNAFFKMYLKHYVLNISRSNRRYLYKLNPILIYEKLDRIFQKLRFKSFVKAYMSSIGNLVEQNERLIRDFKKVWE